MTCDKNIAKDAIDVFNALASDDTVKSVDKLLCCTELSAKQGA